MTRFGTVISVAEPVMAELAAEAFDLAWIDLEHGALSTADVQPLAIAIQSTGAEAHVRLPSSRAERLSAVVDAGVDGVVFPCVESGAEAREIAARLAYPPCGRRGYGPRRSGRFGRAHDAGRPACTVQIESGAGVEAAADIAATPGVDALVLGCADLALDLGVPLGLDSPELADASRRVAAAAAGHGAVYGVAGSGPAAAIAGFAGRAAELIVFSVDVRLYAAGVDAQAEALRAAVEASGAPA